MEKNFQWNTKASLQGVAKRKHKIDKKFWREILKLCIVRRSF